MMLGMPLENADVRMTWVYAPPDLTCVVSWNGMRYEVTGPAPSGVIPEVMSIAANNIDARLDYFVRLETP